MELWFPKAKRVPGPVWKQHGATNTASGVVCHSAVGYRAGLHHEKDRPDRDVGWHFSAMQDGTVEQHYPINAVIWHCSDAWGNRNLNGIEHEGGFQPADEPLTAAQRAASVELVQWLAEQGDWTPSRDVPKTLFEHREISDTGTQCPSGRIPWAAYLGKQPAKPKEDEEPMSNAYIVSPGDTLGAIGKRFDLSVAQLATLNGLGNPNVITVGQVLRLSQDAPQPAGGSGIDAIAALGLVNNAEALVREVQKELGKTKSVLTGGK